MFLCVLESGSLSAAGRELGMTQPAVSNHLHALEERFGVSLVSRGRPMRATPAGENLAGHARRVLGEVAELEEGMARHAGPRGRLAVGVSSTPGELLLPRLAVEFSGRYPEVTLDARVVDTEETVALLLEREVEVALVGRTVEHPRLVGRVVEEDDLVPVAAASDPLVGRAVEAEALDGRPFVLREKGSATRLAVEEGLAGAGLGEPRVAMELGSNAAVTGAVAAGAGIGVVPARTLGTQAPVERLDVRGLSFSRPFVLLVERGRPLSPAAEAFVGLCTERTEKGCR
ncbi:MAG: LysR substrate-binding domain-containing protein [Actinomycetota bacterium]|nr:LysR substrate-binding domain-containing protein [Actinomycetota bacterium]